MSQIDPQVDNKAKDSGSSLRWADLGIRLISALILLAVTAFAVWLNGVLFALLVTIVFAWMYREWLLMVSNQMIDAKGYFLLGLVALVALAAIAFSASVAMILLAAAMLVALTASGQSRLWLVTGVLVFGAVTIAIGALRGDGSPGFAACFFLGATVWMTDTGAFFVGRQLGGAKLSPDISPGKTWTGAIGGLVIGTLSGLVFWLIMTPSPWWIGVLVAGAISISGQIGDLAESAVKRHFHLKDTGDLIPGHGGFMDRLDSLTFGALVAFAIGFIHAGPGQIPSGLLLW